MFGVRMLLGGRLASPRRLVPLLATLTLFLPLARVARAEPASVIFSVNTRDDVHAANPAGGVCETAPGNGRCSLRAALEVTNKLAAGVAVTINVPAGHYFLSLGELDLAPIAQPNSVTIQGSGAASTVLDARHSSTVLVITATFAGLGAEGWLATIDGLTIQNGQGTGGPQAGVIGGGLVNNFGTVTLSNAIVRHNTVKGPAMIDGGGITNHGALTISNTTISGNSVTGISESVTVTGGGVANGGPLTLSRATISGNSVNGGVGVGGVVGGGVSNRAPMTLTNATLSGNSLTTISGAVSSGALIAAGGLADIARFPINPLSPPVGLSNVTIGANIVSGVSATAMAGGLAVQIPAPGFNPLTLANSIVATNTGGDCAGALGDQGYNLDGDGSCGLTTVNHDLPATDPRLGPLQLNAPGSIETMALLPDSAAIDAGGTLANVCPVTDERGVSRPQGSACDIGAYEVLVVSRAPGGPVSQTVSPVAHTDHLVKISNRSPGLENLRLQVNGILIEVEELRRGDQRPVDIASALRPGLTNTVVLSAEGETGGSAEVRIEPSAKGIEDEEDTGEDDDWNAKKFDPH